MIITTAVYLEDRGTRRWRGGRHKSFKIHAIQIQNQKPKKWWKWGGNEGEGGGGCGGKDTYSTPPPSLSDTRKLWPLKLMNYSPGYLIILGFSKIKENTMFSSSYYEQITHFWFLFSFVWLSWLELTIGQLQRKLYSHASEFVGQVPVDIGQVYWANSFTALACVTILRPFASVLCLTPCFKCVTTQGSHF